MATKIPVTHTPEFVSYLYPTQANYENQLRRIYTIPLPHLRYDSQKGLEPLSILQLGYQKLKHCLGATNCSNQILVNFELMKFLNYGLHKGYLKTASFYVNQMKSLHNLDAPPELQKVYTIVTSESEQEQKITNLFQEITDYFQKNLSSLEGRILTRYSTEWVELSPQDPYGTTFIRLAEQALKNHNYVLTFEHIESLVQIADIDPKLLSSAVHILIKLINKKLQNPQNPLEKEKLIALATQLKEKLTGRDTYIDKQSLSLAIRKLTPCNKAAVSSSSNSSSSCDESSSDEKDEDFVIIDATDKTADSQKPYHAKRAEYDALAEEAVLRKEYEVATHLFQKIIGPQNVDRYIEICIEGARHFLAKRKTEHNLQQAIRFFEKAFLSLSNYNADPIYPEWFDTYIETLAKVKNKKDIAIHRSRNLAQFHIQQIQSEKHLTNEEIAEHLQNKEQDILQAIRYLRHLTKLNPKNADYFFKLGILQDFLKETNPKIDSSSSYLQASKLNKNNPWYAYGLYQSYKKSQEDFRNQYNTTKAEELRQLMDEQKKKYLNLVSGTFDQEFIESFFNNDRFLQNEISAVGHIYQLDQFQSPS